MKFCRLDLLVLADLHCASSVRNLALKFIVDNGKEIVSQVIAFRLLIRHIVRTYTL